MCMTHVMLRPDEMTWGPAPSTLPRGVRVAVIEGDPRAAGPFTMRLWFPAGTRVEPHVHPGIEHGTVLSGTVSIAMGSVFSTEGLRPLQAGGFFVIPPDSPHFGVVDEDAVIQAHGMGPWQTTYIKT
jgi:quercetin dioxygenase-like cupin family protein